MRCLNKDKISQINGRYYVEFSAYDDKLVVWVVAEDYVSNNTKDDTDIGLQNVYCIMFDEW